MKIIKLENNDINADISNQNIYDFFNVLVSNAITIKYNNHIIINAQDPTTITDHSIENTAAHIADISCILLSIFAFLKLGTAPTNMIDAHVKNDKNCHTLPSVASNQAGNKKPDVKNIIIGNKYLSHSFFSLYM